MFIWGGILDQTGGTPVVTLGLLVWAEEAQLLDAISGGSPVANGANVVRWLAEDSITALDQTNGSIQPDANIDDAFPGRSGVTFTATQNLTTTLTAAPGTILIIVGPQGALPGTLVSRDTSQVTTAPAFSIAIEETP